MIRASMSCILWSGPLGRPHLQRTHRFRHEYDDKVPVRHAVHSTNHMVSTAIRSDYFVCADRCVSYTGLRPVLCAKRWSRNSTLHWSFNVAYAGTYLSKTPVSGSEFHATTSAFITSVTYDSLPPGADTTDPTLVCSILNDCRPFWGTPGARRFNA